ncbi:MAG: flagellar type III secretion system pore protein FliP [Bacillota bacterium]|uniref:flagellar type III secretion system pore protein FliP n=1 Tax=Desulfurispora thermophila TaxID=265470 RepID=UPI000381873D|nr:flagellar type III secretion system pore protein FliP [Desulfurispora thermophila]
MKRLCLLIFLLLIFLVSYPEPTLAVPQQGTGVPAQLPGINLQLTSPGNPQQVVDSVKILVLLTILSLAPAILITVTSFTRIIVVLSLLRSALGVQQAPPNQVLIALAIFLTIFIMTPVVKQINEQALEPYLQNKISQQDAFTAASAPLKQFMLKNTREKDLELFVALNQKQRPRNAAELELSTVIPAFMISELKTAFQMGVMLYIPFLVIDMVVASTLMSMGMFMLPPVMISLPFKILLFVMVDGWYLVVKSLVESFAR